MGLGLIFCSPKKNISIADINGATFSTPEGPINVLRGHAPLVAEITGDRVTVKLSDGTQKCFSVKNGYADVKGDLIEVFATEVVEIE